ncbi:MAG: nucleoside triphosphate pyrophosphohydrolase [Chloroflexi bacterium]|nr:nucleoside triphosphate pyrophosphohydrolase [Chloroflexota bacterium]
MTNSELPAQIPSRTMEDLLAVVERLRNPGGCPWDREQTHASLRPNLLEESYEALEALDLGDADALAEELGDLLVQVAFHADIAARAGEWVLADVVEGVVDKLVRRHPHVFEADGPALETAEQVSQQWDNLKRKEPGRDSITNGLPSGMPALAYAAALQRRAGRAGLPAPVGDGDDLYPRPEADEADLEAAAGRQLFDAVARIQATGIDPEVALRAETIRYRDRIRRTEALAGDTDALRELLDRERDQLWERARLA